MSFPSKRVNLERFTNSVLFFFSIASCELYYCTMQFSISIIFIITALIIERNMIALERTWYWRRTLDQLYFGQLRFEGTRASNIRFDETSVDILICQMILKVIIDKRLWRRSFIISTFIRICVLIARYLCYILMIAMDRYLSFEIIMFNLRQLRNSMMFDTTWYCYHR